MLQCRRCGCPIPFDRCPGCGISKFVACPECYDVPREHPEVLPVELCGSDPLYQRDFGDEHTFNIPVHPADPLGSPPGAGA